MNKILNFNVGNQVFAIEENAYKSLDNYLNTLKTYFKYDQDSSEIISDLESRIAEIFTSSTSKKKPFVSQLDVEEVMVKLGKTEDFDPVQKAVGGETISQTAVAKSRKMLQKKLMRDPNDRIIGGVCAGLAHYFGVTPIIMRLAVLALFLTAGVGLLIYLILWMIMPLAKTSTDFMLMKGLTIDDASVIGNIKAKAEPLNQNNFDPQTGAKKLVRLTDDKIIAGVAAGLADYFNIDKVFVRLAFIGFTIFNGVGILLYIALWVTMPTINQPATLRFNINR